MLTYCISYIVRTLNLVANILVWFGPGNMHQCRGMYLKQYVTVADLCGTQASPLMLQRTSCNLSFILLLEFYVNLSESSVLIYLTETQFSKGCVCICLLIRIQIWISSLRFSVGGCGLGISPFSKMDI